MGLSASQSRLLSLTSRMSDLELQAQTISNSKIRLSQESSQASKNYSAALDKQAMKVYTGLQSNGTSSYIDATAANLTGYHVVSSTDKQRFIKNANGNVIVSQEIADAYEKAMTTEVGESDTAAGLQKKDLDEVLELYSDYIGNDADMKAFFENCYSGLEGFLANLDYTSNPDNENKAVTYDKSATSHYANVFAEMKESGYVVIDNDNLKNSEWLSEQVQAGNLYLYEYDEEGGANGTGDFVGVSWTSGDNSLRFQSDDTDTAKAEADYEATMADIETKDKQFDVELQNINTEHTAIQTEVDSVKKIISKNIDRSFKIFDA